jgi:NitT/TauT family transport system ATP-binding protein
LLKIIEGIVPATEGGILLEDQTINKTCTCRAMVFQEPALYPWKTVAQNVELALVFRKVAPEIRKKIAAEKIEIAGLNGYEGYYPYQLSGGMKQKTQLARILAMNPDIVLLDEPFASMDEILKYSFDNYLLNIWEQEKKTFILVTHSIEEALLLADRIIVMKPNPGEIHSEHIINIPRPRDLFSKEIVELRKNLRHELSKFY